MIGYVAKDKNGELYLYTVNPEWCEKEGQWCGDGNFISLNECHMSEFRNLTYKDKPIKVEIKFEKV